MSSIEKFPDNAVCESDGISIPLNAAVFNIMFHCMNPVFREGQKVIAIPHDGLEIADGTPVIVKIPEKGFLCKVWKGRKGDNVELGFFNGQTTGRPGTMTIPANVIKEIWSILGIWFDGIMPNAGKTITLEVRKETRSLATTTSKVGNPWEKEYANDWGTSWDDEIRRHRDRIIAMRRMFKEAEKEKDELEIEFANLSVQARKEGWWLSTNTVLHGRSA
jgi:hypothetical protein